ncbi:hypothetical protein B0H13DRAFT_2667838, partial [Mycena leptocephala]
MDRPLGPERHAVYEDIFGRPAPRTDPSPQPPQRPYAAYPNPNPQGYHPHPNQYQRPPAPPYHPHPHPHAYLPHPQQQQHAPQYGNGGRTRQHTGAKPPPFVPARRPHARATPTHERTGHDVPAGEAGAAVEALGVACPTTAFARVAAIGPTCAESGVLSLEVRRLGRAGVIGNGDANGNGIEEAGEEDDEESELPWATAVGSQCESSFHSLLGFIWVFLHRISLLFLSLFVGAIPFRGRERGFGFGLLAQGAVLRTRCVSAFLPLGLELAGTGRDRTGGRLPRGRYPSPVLGSPNLSLPNLRLRLWSLTSLGLCLATPSRRRGCTDRKGKQTRMGVDGMQVWV